MSEKSDDIKQLFSHLGLNPSDYQEIRSAPSANATVTEAPRRWSLLQATSKQPLPSKVAPILNTLPAAVPAAVPRPGVPATPSQWAELLPRATTAPAAVPTAAVPTVAAPAPLADQPLAEGLRSLFQSVREPVPVVPLPVAPTVDVPPPVETAAEQVYRELRGGGAIPPAPPPPAWAGYDAEQETRYAVPPAASKPAPAPTASVAPAPAPVQARIAAAAPPVARAPSRPEPPRAESPAPAKSHQPPRPAPPPAVEVRAAAPELGSDLQAAFRRLAEPEPPRAAASGRLRLRTPATPQVQGSASREARLDDVLRRISGHNGPSK